MVWLDVRQRVDTMNKLTVLPAQYMNECGRLPEFGPAQFSLKLANTCQG